MGAGAGSDVDEGLGGGAVGDVDEEAGSGEEQGSLRIRVTKNFKLWAPI